MSKRILMSALPIRGHFNPALAVAKRLIVDGYSLKFALAKQALEWIPPQIEWEKTNDVHFSYEPVIVRFHSDFFLRDIQKLRQNIRYVFEAWTESQLCAIRDIVLNYRPDLIISDTHHLAPLIVARKERIPSAVLGVTPYRKLRLGSAPPGTGLAPTKIPLLRLTYKLLNRFIELKSYRVRCMVANRLLDLSPELSPIIKKDNPISVFEISEALSNVFFQCSAPCLEDDPASLPKKLKFIGPMNQEPLSPTQHSQSNYDGAKRLSKNVVMTWGTMQPTLPREFISIAKKVLAQSSNIKIIFVPPDAHRLEAKMLTDTFSPPATVTTKFSEFVSVLKNADLLVSNGGFGAVKTALTLGVPVVCFGNQDDKPDVCGRVHRSKSGIGIRWYAGELRIVRAIRRILADESYAEQAKKVGNELAILEKSRTLESVVKDIVR